MSGNPASAQPGERTDVGIHKSDATRAYYHLARAPGRNPIQTNRMRPLAACSLTKCTSEIPTTFQWPKKASPKSQAMQANRANALLEARVRRHPSQEWPQQSAIRYHKISCSMISSTLRSGSYLQTIRLRFTRLYTMSARTTQRW